MLRRRENGRKGKKRNGSSNIREGNATEKKKGAEAREFLRGVPSRGPDEKAEGRSSNYDITPRT